MRMTEEGLALIRRFEGLRHEAYRDAVGVWTIGYGHTSAAGPPHVSPGLRLSDAEAATVLARDVEMFAAGVRNCLRVTLDDHQFSALVSFAYNVGLGNFRSSSVLKAVNAGDKEAVPRRLNRWVKAGGRILPGLVTRRAAEGALFAGPHSAEDAAPPPASRPVEQLDGKPPAESRTLWAALAAAVAAAAQVVLAPRTVVLVLAAAVLVAAAFIIQQRIKKLKEEGV